ncbi:TPA: hypothetical protein BOS_22689 [Bos taurus]|nr:TPA: hypothetical protein BOS_22689 [Bos taurus]
MSSFSDARGRRWFQRSMVKMVLALLKMEAGVPAQVWDTRCQSSRRGCYRPSGRFLGLHKLLRLWRKQAQRWLDGPSEPQARPKHSPAPVSTRRQGYCI